MEYSFNFLLVDVAPSQ